MKRIFKATTIILVLLNAHFSFAQLQNPSAVSDGEILRYKISEDGSRYFQVAFLNQTWIRFNESNPGTMVEADNISKSLDIGLRRTRIQLFGQITDKVFIYFQFGQNNFNSQFNSNSNRKLALFFHDALCEYKVSNKNQLKLGAGLTIASGLSRFSQPSVSSIMTMDVPVFAQTTVDQTDQFSRKLSVFARGQIRKVDYRFILSDPFPVTSSGSIPPLAPFSNFSQYGHTLQQQAYLTYQFLDEEPHTTPYMAGTYLGKKKIFNVATGSIYQKDAMWHQDTVSLDTLYEDLKLFSVESYLDIPLNRERGTAISAYVGFFLTNYGKNYLRYNGVMNPANSSNLNASNSISGQGPTYGNSLPMFGTGNVFYTQLGYLFPKLKSGHQVMSYLSVTASNYDRLNNLMANTFNAGVNYFIKGHNAKLTLDIQNRPVYKVENGLVKPDKRKNCLTLQYQIFF